jgi:hypothetical protein
LNFVCVCVCVCVCDAVGQIQVLAHAKQVLYH